TYQGTELWDFSLVDPDNRRPVDQDRRRKVLAELRGRLDAAGMRRTELARELVETREDGRIKLYVHLQGLRQRRAHPNRVAAGEYLPVQVEGARQEHLFAFLRRQEDRWAMVVVPRFLTRLVPSLETLPLGPEVWQDTRLLLPDLPPGVRLE